MIHCNIFSKKKIMENTFEPINEQNETVAMPETSEETNGNAHAAFEEEGENSTNENPDEDDADELNDEEVAEEATTEDTTNEPTEE
jgi:hypothetical protein